jgi:hypothetical protein
MLELASLWPIYDMLFSAHERFDVYATTFRRTIQTFEFRLTTYTLLLFSFNTPYPIPLPKPLTP